MRRTMLTVECNKTNSIDSTKAQLCQVTVIAAAYLVIRNARKTRKRKHRWWKKELFIGNVTAHNDFLGRLLANDQSLFTNFSRMSVEDFNILGIVQLIAAVHQVLLDYFYTLLTVYPIGLEYFCNFL